MKTFNLGDLIYSPDFRNGTLGTVTKVHDDSSYTIEDEFILGQPWRAKPSNRPSYTWRLATDNDIINQMDRYLSPTKVVLDYGSFELTEDSLYIRKFWDDTILDFNEAVALRNYLNYWIKGE